MTLQCLNRIISPSVPEHATLPRTAARWPCHKVPSGLPNARPMLDAVADHWQPIALRNAPIYLSRCSGFPHWVLCCDSAARGCTPHFVPANCDRTLVCSAQCPLRSTHRACVPIVLCSSNSPMFWSHKYLSKHSGVGANTRADTPWPQSNLACRC